MTTGLPTSLWGRAERAVAALGRLRAIAAAFRRDRQGAVAAMTAGSAVVLLGFTGIATDLSLWENAKRSAQSASDQAALAAAIVTPCATGLPSTCYQTAGEAVAGQQGFVNGNANGDTVNIYYPMSNDTTNCPANATDPNCSNPSAIEAVITAPQPLFFSRLFLGAVTVAARSVVNKNLFPTCMLALDNNASDNHSIYVDSGAIVNMNNCSITDVTPRHGTGLSWDSVDFKENGGIGQMTVSAVIIARDGVCDGPGGTTSSYNVGNCNGDFHIVNPAATENFSNNSPGYSPFVLTGRSITNPYAGLTVPAPSGACPTPASSTNGLAANNAGGINVNITTSTTLNPGTYCGCPTTNGNGLVCNSSGTNSGNANAALTITGTPSTVTISQGVAGPGVSSGDAIEFFHGATTTANTQGPGATNKLTVASATGIAVGYTAADITNSGGVPSGTTVTAVSGTTVTLSNNVTTGPGGFAGNDEVAFINGSPTTLDASAATTSGTTLSFGSVGNGIVSDGMAVVDTTTTKPTNPIPVGTTVTNVSAGTASTVTLNAGVYVLDGWGCISGGGGGGPPPPPPPPGGGTTSKSTSCLSGDLVITNGATVTGTGVTIVLSTSQRSSANSGVDVGNVYVDSASSLDISAPTSAPAGCASCSGMALWQDPCTGCTEATPSPKFPINPPTTPPAGTTLEEQCGADDLNLIGSGSTANINGIIYFPAQAVLYQGANTSTTTSCTQIVAWGIWFLGNTQFTYGSNCSSPNSLGPIAGVPVVVE